MVEEYAGPKLKPGGKFLIALVIGGLLYLAWDRFKDVILPPAKTTGGTIDPDRIKDLKGGTQEPAKNEPASGGGVTTVDTYSFVPATGLKDTVASSYEFKDNTVVFPINIWGGWAPVIAANNGFSPNKDSIFFKEFKFLVDLRLIDAPDQARQAYASGKAHILWGTLDMIALFAPGLSKDPRVVPKVFQQVDWSEGGDGIVVRQHIRQIADLRGKTIVLAQNSPSHFYILNLLSESGVQPHEVNFKYTDTAFGAAKAFVEVPHLDACVSWAPDIYNIVDPKEGGKPGGVKGAKLLSTTRDANRVIADVWAVRADFARDHRDIVKGLVVGIFKGMDLCKQNPDRVAQLMSDGFSLPVEDCKGMMGDAHLTNFAENRRFFHDPNFGANFDRTWKIASYVYKQMGAIGTPVRPEDCRDGSILEELDKAGLFAAHKIEDRAVQPWDPKTITAEITPILVKTIRVHFKTNSPELDTVEDAGIPQAIEEIGRLAEKFGAARIMIEGNTDSTMKGYYSDPKMVKQLAVGVQQLSEARAEAVKRAVMEKFKMPPEKFYCKGNGWDSPIVPNANSPDDHAKNRRVEIKVLPLEGK